LWQAILCGKSNPFGWWPKFGKKIVAAVWFSATNVWQILVATVWMAAKNSTKKSTQLLQKNI
jgi:hypothetical protein